MYCCWCWKYVHTIPSSRHHTWNGVWKWFDFTYIILFLLFVVYSFLFGFALLFLFFFFLFLLLLFTSTSSVFCSFCVWFVYKSSLNSQFVVVFLSKFEMMVATHATIHCVLGDFDEFSHILGSGMKKINGVCDKIRANIQFNTIQYNTPFHIQVACGKHIYTLSRWHETHFNHQTKFIM